ncbi:hypothetical protein PARMER_03584 [Parabacteroides merdae ATCC 43184]|nr:hypothetical protein PARMER_03584 [Parabacteroides merdae ATCC 43184]
MLRNWASSNKIGLSDRKERVVLYGAALFLFIFVEFYILNV